MDPSLRKDKWTEEEDRRICAAQSRLGNRFAEIAKHLNGRSEKMVSRRWSRGLIRKAEQILEGMTKEDFAFLGDIVDGSQVGGGMGVDAHTVRGTPICVSMSEGHAVQQQQVSSSEMVAQASGGEQSLSVAEPQTLSLQSLE